MTTAVTTSHIVLDDQGRAWIAGANRRVTEVVAEKLAWGWDADEIHRQHPDLPLAKIHAAFAYYYDHQAELDAALVQELKHTEALRTAAGPSPLGEHLRQTGKLG